MPERGGTAAIVVDKLWVSLDLCEAASGIEGAAEGGDVMEVWDPGVTVPLVSATDTRGCAFSDDVACVVISEANGERSAPVRRAVVVGGQACEQ